MQLVRSQTMDYYLPGVACDEAWLDLYRDHRAITKVVIFVYEPNGMWPYKSKNIQKDLDDSRMVSNWAKNQPEQFEAIVKEEYYPTKLLKFIRLGIRLTQRNYKRELKQFNKIARGKIHEIDDDVFDERVKISPELHFYMRLVLPCMCVSQVFIDGFTDGKAGMLAG